MSAVANVAFANPRLTAHWVHERVAEALGIAPGVTRLDTPAPPLAPCRSAGARAGRDMGRSSSLLVGSARATRETFSATCHGAGRRMSRRQATRIGDAGGSANSKAPREHQGSWAPLRASEAPPHEPRVSHSPDTWGLDSLHGGWCGEKTRSTRDSIVTLHVVQGV